MAMSYEWVLTKYSDLGFFNIYSLADRLQSGLEAGAGIEPANRGFADLGLTTWLPRRRENLQHRL
jgi:hypothetical protein